MDAMTIHAHPATSVLRPAPDSDHPTHGIAADQPDPIDAHQLLDHRTQERLIPELGAPSGRYLAVERDGETWLIALDRPLTQIGRGLVADVRLEDAHVSRRHAILALRGEGARVLDDRSANGTFVNGRRVTIAQLTDGDVLRIGRAVLRYVEVRPPRRAEPLRRIPLGVRGRRGAPGGLAAA